MSALSHLWLYLKLMFWVFMIFCVCVIFYGLIYGPHNTETVCFDDEGNVIFYASGYKPNTDDHPLIQLTEDMYRIRETGEVLHAQCRISWGTRPPKGVEYYGGMKDD